MRPCSPLGHLAATWPAATRPSSAIPPSSANGRTAKCSGLRSFWVPRLASATAQRRSFRCGQRSNNSREPRGAWIAVGNIKGCSRGEEVSRRFRWPAGRGDALGRSRWRGRTAALPGDAARRRRLSPPVMGVAVDEQSGFVSRCTLGTHQLRRTLAAAAVAGMALSAVGRNSQAQ